MVVFEVDLFFISKMNPFTFSRHQDFYNTSKEELWDFISSPNNLSKITPDYMDFKIQSTLPEKMYPGMLIAYKVNVLPKIRMSWLTEITHVDEGNYFVDEQREGPYKIWHHEHFLKQMDGFVRMYDKVVYKPPFGILGKVMNRLVIENKLEEIFDYREYTMNQLFAQKKVHPLKNALSKYA